MQDHPISAAPQASLSSPCSRRSFLRAVAGTSLLASVGGCAASSSPTRRSAGTLHSDHDPEAIARLIESTPRADVLEVLGRELAHGLSPTVFQAGLLLAAVRNVNPRPCGFDLHCVFVLHSARELASRLPAEERMLPWMWSLDQFKSAQESDSARGDWRMLPLEGALPSAARAPAELRTAMEEWDAGRAERALVALARAQPGAQLFEHLWEYGARDFRNLAHKAIYTANLQRMLADLGWQHAEPALRSLAASLVYLGQYGRANGYAFEDQCYLANVELAARGLAELPRSWNAPGPSGGSEQELVFGMLNAEAGEAERAALQLLIGGRARAGDLWDGVHLASAEMAAHRSDIVSLHANTAADALHHAFRTSQSPRTQVLVLLQAIGWMNQFARMIEPAGFGEARLFTWHGTEAPADPQSAAREIVEIAAGDRATAMCKAFRYGERHTASSALRDTVFQIAFARGEEAHDYKYPVALFSNCAHVADRWRPHLLASSVGFLPRPGAESDVIERARASLRTS